MPDRFSKYTGLTSICNSGINQVRILEFGICSFLSWFLLLCFYFILQNENLGKRLAHGYPFLEAEVAYCARHEYCESAIDFIARRCRLAFLDTDAAGRALPRIIQILSAEHKWDKARQKQELQKAKEFLETFKSSKNAQFHDGKHSGPLLVRSN